jgi:hypothetical protein
MESIIAWKPHGRAFVVLNSGNLEKVLPSVFKQSSITSFTRQLNLWNFKRLNRKGEDFKCYYHELFLKGRPRLVRLMRRIRVKGVGIRRASVPKDEPNFYEMNPVHPCSNNRAHRMMMDNRMSMRSELLSRRNFEVEFNMVTASPSSIQYQSRIPTSNLYDIQISAGGSGVGTLPDGRDSELILALRQSLLRPSLSRGQLSTNTQAGLDMTDSELILALQQQQSLPRHTPLRGDQIFTTDSELRMALQLSLLQPTRLGGDQMSTSTQAEPALTSSSELRMALQQSLLRPPLPSFSDLSGVQMRTNTQALVGDDSELMLALRQSLIRPNQPVEFQMPTSTQTGSARTAEIMLALQQSLRQPSSSTSSTVFRGQQTSADTQSVTATARFNYELLLARQQPLVRPPAISVFSRPSQNQQQQSTLNRAYTYRPNRVNDLHILDQIRRNDSHGNQHG